MMVFYTLVGNPSTVENMVDPGLAPKAGEFATNAGGASTGADQTLTTGSLPFTFGKTGIGASTDTFPEGRKRVNRYALSEAGSVTGFRAEPLR